MEAHVGVALAMVAAVAATGLLSRKTGLPAPVLLLVEGVVWALIPATPNLRLNHEVLLILVLPPLLYSAALDASLVAIRAHVRDVASLSIGLVLFTTVVVGVTVSAVVPGMPLATGFVLGAIVAPPDAVAAVAVGKRFPLPARLQTVIEGEGLLNDATALTAYAVAVDAVVRSGGISGIAAVGQFLYSGLGGALGGVLVALLVRTVRRRLHDPLVENCLSLATPFLAYLPVEELHASGLTSVVVAGLWLGHQDPELQSGGSRLQTAAVWRLLTFVLEGIVFLLIGLDLHGVLDDVAGTARGTLVAASAVAVGVVLFTRPVWVFGVTWLRKLAVGRVQHRASAPSWRTASALSWAGMRGVVTLAAAESLPILRNDGTPFPDRSLILLLSFVVVAFTLVAQGLTFGVVLTRLGLGRDDAGLLVLRARAHQAALRAGMARLDREVADGSVDTEVVERLRLSAQRRVHAAQESIGALDSVDEQQEETNSAAWRRLRLAMISSERSELLRQRNNGDLPDGVLRDLQSALDLEERVLERG